jgi:intracellular sulfur oxidation DsrE/DsrF family protein
MSLLIKALAAVVLACATLSVAAQDKVVYHFDGGIAQATKGLRNMRNHLDVDPKAKIAAVAHAEGVDFLMEGAMSTNNQQFAALVGDLMARGVTLNCGRPSRGVHGRSVGAGAECAPKSRRKPAGPTVHRPGAARLALMTGAVSAPRPSWRRHRPR